MVTSTTVGLTSTPSLGCKFKLSNTTEEKNVYVVPLPKLPLPRLG